MGKSFVIGDIHGAYRAVEQCFERSNFDMDEDLLICLGDVCDGWPDVYEVFKILLKIKNLEYIIGNHDYWALQWMNTGYSKDIWLNQGGQGGSRGLRRGIDRHCLLTSSWIFRPFVATFARTWDAAKVCDHVLANVATTVCHAIPRRVKYHG